MLARLRCLFGRHEIRQHPNLQAHVCVRKGCSYMEVLTKDGKWWPV